MPTEDRAGFPTYWREYGHGPRKALLIHCSLAHSGAWRGVARLLSDTLTMTAFDMPGHGRSGAWDDREDVQALTTRIASGFADGPVDVIGHSFGATVALRMAVEHPELVRSLALFEPVFFAVALRDFPELSAPYEAKMAPFKAAWAVGDRRAAARAFTGIWGGIQTWEDTPEAQKEALADTIHMIPAGNLSLYGDSGGMLAPGVLAAVKAPVLLMRGATSPAIIAGINRGLAARLPDAECVVVPEAGHMGPITHAGPVACEVRRFLSRVDGTCSAA